jgi:hypothetical protein
MNGAEAEVETDLSTESLPGRWELRAFDMTGSFKITATVALPAEDRVDGDDAVLEVRPFKSYDDVPGFPDCHEVELRDYTVREPPAVETFGASPSETEYLDDTVALVRELATDFLEADE